MSQGGRTEAEALSVLIDQIYACVLDRAGWPGVLATLCERIGGCAASLNVHALNAQRPELLVEHGTDPAASEAYVRTYAAINPLIEATLLYTPVGEARALYRVVDVENFRRSRFYREWVAPQGWGDWLGCTLIRSADSLAMLAVARQERDGPYGDAELDLMGLLTPHISRATVLGRLIDAVSAERAGLSALVERIRAPAFLLDGAGRVAFANAAGRAVLTEGRLLRIASGRLQSPDAAAQRMLEESMAARAPGAAAHILEADDGPRTLCVLPPSDASGGYGVVMLTRREDDLPVPGVVLAEAFGFTPAEVRVLIGLLRRQTLQEIAGALEIAPRTAKAHLQHLFEKTGVNRQSDLIATILALAPPLRLV